MYRKIYMMITSFLIRLFIFFRNNTIIMSGLNLTWQVQYQCMQDQIHEMRLNIANCYDIETDFNNQYIEKERELRRIQMRLDDMVTGQEREFYILKQDERRVTEQLSEIESELENVRRQKQDFERELYQIEIEAQQFAREHRN